MATGATLLPLDGEQPQQQQQQRQQQQPPPPSHCQVCHRSCRPLRCTQCQNAWYCSAECQKVDWKSNHRKTCQSSSNRSTTSSRSSPTTTTKKKNTTGTKTVITNQVVNDTLQELQSLTNGISLNRAQEEYHKAQDEVKRRHGQVELRNNDEKKQEEEEDPSSSNQGPKTKDIPTTIQTKDASSSGDTGSGDRSDGRSDGGDKVSNIASGLERLRASENLPNEDVPRNTKNNNNSNNNTYKENPLDAESESTLTDTSIIASNEWLSSVMVEDMSRIARYQITLKQRQLPPTNQTPLLLRGTSQDSKSHRAITSTEDLDVSTTTIMNDKPSQSNSTLVTIRSRTNPQMNFAVELPRQLIPPISMNSSSSSQHQFHQGSLENDEEDGTIQLRFHYQTSRNDNIHFNNDDNALILSDFHEEYPSPPPCSSITPKVMNTLQCRFCGMGLLPQESVDRVLPLPTGYWDEVTDYLICYSGQPMVDFASSSTCAQPRLALQDSNVLCLHKDDVGDSVCILAVQGYGEETSIQRSDEKQRPIPNDSNSTPSGRPSPIEHKDVSATVRGIRSWVEAVGGASICCSQCCSPLGFASIESPVTYRFLKHRLSVCSGQKIPPSPSAPLITTRTKRIAHELEMVPMSSCASFLAREMVRYAEAKAIFTFVVAKEQSMHLDTAGHPLSSSSGKCILLRLLSWDTVMATRFESSTSRRLQFDRVAKVVFEETIDKQAETRNKGGNNAVTGESEDVTNWVWGGVDLCCLPSQQPVSFNGGNNSSSNNDKQAQEPSPGIVEQGDVAKKSAVRLLLPAEEWEEVRKSVLEGSQWFSKSVSEATILVKMGPNSSPTVGLSAISLGSK